MNEENPVAQLADRASKVLLVLFSLARSNTGITNSQFASLTGARSSQVNALAQLVEASAVEIIPQTGQPCLVRLSRAALFCGTITSEGKTAPGIQAVFLEPARDGDPIQACRVADDAADRTAQIAALGRVWDEVFPVAGYPYQRLTEDAAKRFLANGRRAQDVAQVILDAKAHAREPIKAPRSYVEAALSRMEKGREGGGEGVEITDDLRRLVELGRKQKRDAQNS